MQGHGGNHDDDYADDDVMGYGVDEYLEKEMLEPN